MSQRDQRRGELRAHGSAWAPHHVGHRAHDQGYDVSDGKSISACHCNGRRASRRLGDGSRTLGQHNVTRDSCDRHGAFRDEAPSVAL